MNLLIDKVVKRNFPKNLDEKDNHLFSHEYLFKIQSIEPIEYRNATIDYRGSIIKWGKLINNPINNEKEKIKWSIRDTLYHYLRKKKKNVKLACWLTNEWSTNYFHWFADILPKVLVLLDKDNDYTLILPIDIYEIEFVKHSLRMLNQNVETVRVYEKVSINKIYYIPNLTHTGNYVPELINKVRTKIIEINNFLAEEKVRIYISRQKAPNRRILNEDEVIDILSHYNFIIVNIEELSWVEQLKLMQKCETVLAVHGAGLTNMLWMESNSNIIELRKFDDNINNCYFSLSSALGHNYYYLLCEVNNPNLVTQQNDFIVDIKKLKDLLDLIYGKSI